MFWRYNKKLFVSYKPVSNRSCSDFGIDYSKFIKLLFNSKNILVGTDFLGKEEIEDYCPFYRWFLQQYYLDSIKGKISIKVILEDLVYNLKKRLDYYYVDSYFDDGNKHLNKHKNRFKKIIIIYFKSYIKHINRYYDVDLEKYNLYNNFDIDIKTNHITTYFFNCLRSCFSNREFYQDLISDYKTSISSHNTKYRYLREYEDQVPIEDYIFYRWFNENFECKESFNDGIWKRKKISKPTFQFKQLVKWGIITKSDYNLLMLEMYGRYYKSQIMGFVDDIPELEDYLINKNNTVENQELYKSFIFGLVVGKELKGTFLYKNKTGDNKPQLYLGVYKLMLNNELKL